MRDRSGGLDCALQRTQNVQREDRRGAHFFVEKLSFVSPTNTVVCLSTQVNLRALVLKGCRVRGESRNMVEDTCAKCQQIGCGAGGFFNHGATGVAGVSNAGMVSAAAEPAAANGGASPGFVGAGGVRVDFGPLSEDGGKKKSKFIFCC